MIEIDSNYYKLIENYNKATVELEDYKEEYK